MSIAALAQRLKSGPVPCVPPREPLEGTGKTLCNQYGSLRSFCSPENNKEARESRGEMAEKPNARRENGETLNGGLLKSQFLREPGTADKAAVTAWLDAIGETDPAARAQYLAICARDPRALAWTLAELATMPASVPQVEAPATTRAPPTATPEVACCTCQHFERDTINPRGGLGRCLVDSPSSRRNPALWPWSEAVHTCREWENAFRRRKMNQALANLGTSHR